MKVKQLTVWCNEYRRRFNKFWDTYCIAGDCYVNGYKKSQEEIYKALSLNNVDPVCLDLIFDIGENLVEIEKKSPQIGEGAKPLTKDLFKAEMQKYYKAEIFVSEDEKGNLSFQGTIKK